MKRTLQLICLSAVVYLSMTGYASGPSKAPQKALSARTGCNQTGTCHSASPQSGTQTTITLIDDKGDTVTNGQYIPGKKYQTIIKSANPAVQYGFIALVLKYGSLKEAGTLSNPLNSPQVKITNVDSYTVAEHSSPINYVAGGFQTNFQWTAPAKGTGRINYHVAINLANGNGTADPMDHYLIKTVVFDEAWPATISKTDQLSALNIFPNPANDILNIKFVNNDPKEYHYTVFELSGAVSIQGHATSSKSIDISTLSSGIYFLKVTDGTQQKVIRFSKQ